MLRPAERALKAFYRRHGLDIPDRTFRNLAVHLALLIEEVGEVATAVNKPERRKDLHSELLDVLYVTLGFLISCGYESSLPFRQLHQRNMKKRLPKVVVNGR